MFCIFLLITIIYCALNQKLTRCEANSSPTRAMDWDWGWGCHVEKSQRPKISQTPTLMISKVNNYNIRHANMWKILYFNSWNDKNHALLMNEKINRFGQYFIVSLIKIINMMSVVMMFIQRKQKCLHFQLSIDIFSSLQNLTKNLNIIHVQG